MWSNAEFSFYFDVMPDEGYRDGFEELFTDTED